jgi:Tfp pilus assembly protein PilX
MTTPEHHTKWLTPFAEERGIALVIALLAMVLLSILGVTFLSMSATEFTIASNEVDASRAFFLTEAGTALAKRTLRDTPDWDTLLTDPPTTTACPTIVPASTGSCSYAIVNDTADGGGLTNDTNDLVIIKATGSSQTASREIHLAFTRSAGLPAPPAALLSVGISSNVSFNGNAFTIDGNNWIPPSDDGSTPAVQDNGTCTSTTAPKFGIGVPNATHQLAVKNALSSQQQDNVTGDDPNPPWSPVTTTPSIGVDTTIAQDQVLALVDYLLPLADITYSPGTSITSGTIGTQAAPKIVAVDATSYSGSDPALTLTATSGAGILIVKNGTLALKGNSQWVGLVIVLGSNVAIDVSGGGNKAVYGATLLAEDANVEAVIAEGSGNMKLRYSCGGLDVANLASASAFSGTTVWWKEVF